MTSGRSNAAPSLVYLDNHLLVLCKPPGMPSQPDRSGDLDLLSWGKHFLRERFDKPGEVFLGLVHRIDRPASGLLVFARTSKAASRLAHQFRERSVEKRYLALVEGELTGHGTWVDFIAKVDRRPRLADPESEGARSAELRWQARGVKQGISLVEIELLTGRPHQVRLQFATRGFPLVGDVRYGAARALDGRNLALHAARLGLEHPVRSERMRWWCDPPASWPSQFQDDLRACKDDGTSEAA